MPHEGVQGIGGGHPPQEAVRRADRHRFPCRGDRGNIDGRRGPVDKDQLCGHRVVHDFGEGGPAAVQVQAEVSDHCDYEICSRCEAAEHTQGHLPSSLLE